MDDIKGFAKKYWPYIVGGIVGLYLLLRFSTGGSSQAVNPTYQLPQQAGIDPGLAAQIDAQNQKTALDAKALSAQIDYNNKSLDVLEKKNYSDAFNAFQTSQALMAGAIGESAAQVVGALNAPAITAMQASALENAAALGAAGNVAAASFMAQGDIVSSAANTTVGVASILGGASEAIANTGKKAEKDWAGIINAGANAYGAYMTGGMSTMGNNGGSGSYGSNYYS